LGGVLESVADTSPPFFAAPPVRLAVLTVLAGPIYAAYWFYCAWVHIERRVGRRLQPLAQAITAPASIVFLVQRLRAATPNWPPSSILLALVPLLLLPHLFERVPGRLALLSDLVVLPLLVINQCAIQSNIRVSRGPGLQRGWSRGEIILLCIFVPLNVLATYLVVVGRDAA
jgi:hypothetical protein